MEISSSKCVPLKVLPPTKICVAGDFLILSDKTRDYTYVYAYNLSHRLMHKMYSTNFNKTKRMLVIYKKILDKYLRKALDPHDICYSEIEKQEHEFIGIE